MVDYSTFKKSITHNINESTNFPMHSNPLAEKTDNTYKSAVLNYSQVIATPENDNDSLEILNSVKDMNNLVPRKIKLPYSFNINEINGERIYNKDGSLEYIREYTNDRICDYYSKNDQIEKIIERGKYSGKVIAKIMTRMKKGIRKTNVTVFDNIINNKYTIFQVDELGFIENVTEFSGKGNSFRTLFRNVVTFLPLRYMEVKDDNEGHICLVDAVFNTQGTIICIKRTTTEKEINIKYENGLKIVSVNPRKEK